MENINFKASLVAPDPNEVMYWIDLKEDKLGKIIKVYNADTKRWESTLDPTLVNIKPIIVLLNEKLTEAFNVCTLLDFDLHELGKRVNKLEDRIAAIELKTTKP